MSLFTKTIIFISLFPCFFISLTSSYGHPNTCRTYCSNVTIDYPFGLKYGCGHPGYRDLLYCINNVLMFHVKSGSYRVLNIDYAYQAITLHDPHLSTCDSIVLGSKGNGFMVEPWRAPYLNPAPENAFLLIGCSAKSSLFQGFPTRHLPCRNISGVGCEDYYNCPAWRFIGPTQVGLIHGSSPPECCAVGYDEMGPKDGINLTKLECQGYSSAYSLAPLKVDGPHEWSYGIRVKYSVQGHDAFCKACEATGGTCGFSGGDDDKSDGITELCFCRTFNSTSNCDSLTASVEALSSSACILLQSSRDVTILAGVLLYILSIWIASH